MPRSAYARGLTSCLHPPRHMLFLGWLSRVLKRGYQRRAVTDVMRAVAQTQRFLAVVVAVCSLMSCWPSHACPKARRVEVQQNERRKSLRAYVAKNMSHIDECYRSAPSMTAPGKLESGFEIAITPIGTVRGVWYRGANVAGSLVATCIKRVLGKVRLTKASRTQYIVVKDFRLFGAGRSEGIEGPVNFVNARDELMVELLLGKDCCHRRAVSMARVGMKAGAKTRVFRIRGWLGIYVLDGRLGISDRGEERVLRRGCGMTMESSVFQRISSIGRDDARYLMFFAPPGPEMFFAKGDLGLETGVDIARVRQMKPRIARSGVVISTSSCESVKSTWKVVDERLIAPQMVAVERGQRVLFDAKQVGIHYVVVVVDGAFVLQKDGVTRRLLRGAADYIDADSSADILAEAEGTNKLIVFVWPKAGGWAFPFSGTLLTVVAGDLVR